MIHAIRFILLTAAAIAAPGIAPGSALAQLDSGNSQPARYTIRSIPVPDGYTFCGIEDINAAGLAAGAAYNASGGSPVVVLTDGHIDFLPELGGTYDYATAINDQGQIAGVCQSQPWWGSKAIRWDADGSMHVIYPITGDEHDNIYAHAINNLGHVVGQSEVAGGMMHAFSWHESTGLIDLGTLGGSYSGANDVNDHGHVVGWSWSDIQAETPFIWRGGELNELDSLPIADFPGGSANAINNHGVIVGESNGEEYGIEYAVRWNLQGDIQRLGSIGGTSSAAYDINDSGVIVGKAQIESGEFHAFIHANGQMRDLNDFLPPNSGWTLFTAHAISSDGRIVGYGVLNGESRGFVLEPAPLRPTRIFRLR